jgi:CubicO group peptidase (beta-lactamase class C family)
MVIVLKMLSVFPVRKLSSLLLSFVLMVTIGVNSVESPVNGSTTASNITSTSSSPLLLPSQQDLPFNSTSEDDESKITEQIKELLRERIDNNKTNAAIAIGLVDKNGTQFYSYGQLSHNSNAKVDQNTIFAIGSNTKVFTALLLVVMVNNGLVNLDDPVERYLPVNVTVPQYKGHKITLEDLATHTSGLPEWPYNYCPQYDPSRASVQDSIQFRLGLINCTKDYTMKQFYQAFSNTSLSGEPGSQFHYSTFGSGLLGHILVLKSNMSSYEELLQKRILDVLGMNSTGINLSEQDKMRLAIGHYKGQEIPMWNLSAPIEGGGAIYSTAADMVKFLSANIGLIKTVLDKPMQDSHLIRHGTGQLLPNNLQTSEGAKLDYYVGLGWIISTNFGHEIIWHNGATASGYNAFMGFNPTTERGVVILTSDDITSNNVSNIVFNDKDTLSNLIMDLLTRN